jgi:peptide deformylase
LAVLEIRKYPDPVLRRKSKPVTEITPEIQKLIDDMIETMYAAPGVGLAAPQVGISLRITVIDVSTKDDPHPLLVLINPEIISQEGELNEEEGCLSVTDFQSNVTRYAKVRIRATDRGGKVYEAQGEELLARAFQHELDHLDGILFIDRISPLKRDLFKRRIKKNIKEDKAEVG